MPSGEHGQAIVDKGCRRGAMIGALGPRLRGDVTGRARRGDRRADRGPGLRRRRARRSSSSCRPCGASPRSPCRRATRTGRSTSVVTRFARSVAVDERVAADAVRRHRRTGRTRSRTTGRGSGLAGRVRAQLDPIRGCRRSPPSTTAAASWPWPMARPGSRAAHWNRPIDGWDRRGRAWEATWARLDLAHCLVRMSRFADAVDRGERRPGRRYAPRVAGPRGPGGRAAADGPGSRPGRRAMAPTHGTRSTRSPGSSARA